MPDIVRLPMFDGFRPELQGWFFERRIVPSAIALGVLLVGTGVYIATLEAPEDTIEVALADPELSDFAVEEEEPEIEEEEPEPEAPPPPPPDAKVKRVKKLTPKPKPQTPISKPTEAADETDKEKVYEVPMDGQTNRTGFGGGTGKPSASPKTGTAKKPKPEKPKAPKKRKEVPIDPTKPIDRPENATVPKPLPANAQPEYPKKLRDEGITGRIVLKLHVHRDGSVRGAKVLAKKTSATTEDEKKAAENAFLKAVIKVVKTWKFKPATLEGKPITVWHKVTIPFQLTD